MVEPTLLDDVNIYASEYQLYLPSKKDLKKRLIECAETALQSKSGER